MNDRIKELAERANAWYPEGYPSAEGGDEAWKNLVIFEKEDLQKFALLIVRECVNIVNSLEQYEGQGDCSTAEYIKERFGVEE